jgi:tight adherence protein B
MSRRRGPKLLLAASGVVAIAGLVLPSASAAPSSTPTLVVRSVDATAYPTVTLVAQQTGSAGGSLTVNGGAPRDVKAATASDAGLPVGLVVVVDGTKFMSTDSRLDWVRQKLHQLADHLPANVQIGLVQAGVNARVVSGLTSSSSEFGAAVDTMNVSNRTEAATYDGVALAVQMLAAAPKVQPNIVLISANGDAGQGTRLGAVRGDLINRGISLTSVVIATNGIDHDGLRLMARDSGGQVYEVKSPAELTAGVSDAVSFVSAQRVITFTGPTDAKVVNLTLTTGTQAASGFVLPGTKVVGHDFSPPGVTHILGTGPKFLQGTNGKLIGAGLALVAVALFAFGLGLIILRDTSGLDAVLAHYGEDRQVVVDGDEADHNNQSQLVQRAVEFTTSFAESRGVITWLEAALEKADLPLRAGEALFFYAAIAVITAGAVFVFTGSWITGLASLGGLAFLPPGLLNFLAVRRQKKFEAMLPDMLQLLSSTLKAGYSLMQGIEAVSREVPDPVGKELRRVVVEARLGRPLEESLDEAAKRMNSSDFGWAVMAIGIQREVGGNLAELLLTVSETMVQRERLRRDVKALTAEGRVSAYMLGVLPIGVGAAMYALNKEYIMTLFTDSTGHICLGVAIFGMVAGFIWMNKLIKVEV